MPYLVCVGCRLSVYSAAAHSTVDNCPRCGTRLFAGPSRLTATPPGTYDRREASWLYATVGPEGRGRADRLSRRVEGEVS